MQPGIIGSQGFIVLQEYLACRLKLSLENPWRFWQDKYVCLSMENEQWKMDSDFFSNLNQQTLHLADPTDNLRLCMVVSPLPSFSR
jgi:hypothetical protein